MLLSLSTSAVAPKAPDMRRKERRLVFMGRILLLPNASSSARRAKRQHKRNQGGDEHDTLQDDDICCRQPGRIAAVELHQLSEKTHVAHRAREAPCRRQCRPSGLDVAAGLPPAIEKEQAEEPVIEPCR